MPAVTGALSDERHDKAVDALRRGQKDEDHHLAELFRVLREHARSRAARLVQADGGTYAAQPRADRQS